MPAMMYMCVQHKNEQNHMKTNLDCTKVNMGHTKIRDVKEVIKPLKWKILSKKVTDERKKRLFH